ncbi:MAG: phenylalanine--tRNA ligase subunit beta, partial [Myxococcales bacterium]|nr:phenylalanine--tRNA ligase subunit beta [Myxococcales bacterium]
MLISCSWLNELLEGAPISLGEHAGAVTPARVAEILTNLGLEVDGVSHHELAGVIVGELRSVERHPNSEKLSLVSLFDGEQELQVVCGAQNLPGVGGKVAFAPVGTILPGGLELTVREVRGLESRGMICSEDELEIGSDGDGILILPQDWAAGTPLTRLVPGIVDVVIEIAVTPNRPDALGHMGVAIDLSVALTKDLGKTISTRTPKLAALKPAEAAHNPELVAIPAGDRCGRYLGYALADAKVGRSPLWLRVRLHRVGLRAINDVVDITNLVLMETGQPLHAFDRDKLGQGRVVVRMAAADEPMTTLDDSEVTLTADDLVIA